MRYNGFWLWSWSLCSGFRCSCMCGEVSNISSAIHLHTLFLLHAHSDQLTHRPFVLLSVVIDLESFIG
ncbi:hypothetical protein HanOQP8_Chr04g0154861 [Helianthus annuus]|nr:hypothetical protein HanHA89_Chr02g0069461 [Helianthus annuus]KAJ0695581.1 hypothetical protein HanLR1_Chr10g0347171 [Helianthus annuus]KAJ0761862.1 hypothetical protein HanOQP8_Chr04g0154861 [Helianthus annuus]